MVASPNVGPGMFSASEETKTYRLAPELVAVLRDVARGCEESDAGLRTRYFVDLAATSGVRDVGDVHLFDVEKWCDGNELLAPWGPKERWVRRRRVRRALAHLHGRPDGLRHVGVLHVHYGWPDPFVRSLPPNVRKDLDELAGLARYTDAVEDHRRAMVAAAADEAATQLQARALAEVQARPAVLERLRVRRAQLEAKLAELSDSAGEDAETAALATGREIDRVDRAIDRTQKALSRDRASAVEGGQPAIQAGVRFSDRLAKADREISSADALLDAANLADSERIVFLTSVRIDANRMLSAASRAFHESWLRS